MLRPSGGMWVLLLTLASLAAAQDLKIDSIGMNNLRLYRPGCWSEVRATIVNPAPIEQTGLITLSIGQMHQVQFAAEPWIPPQARRSITIPLNLRVNVPADQRSWPMVSRLIRNEPAGERAIESSDSLLLTYQDRVSSAAMIHSLDDQDDDAARRLLGALRKMDSTLGPATLSLSPDDAPRSAAAYDGLDTLLLCAPDPRLDDEQLQALRAWLLGGGRLWIMLDQTPASLGQALLGDDWRISVIDRRELTRLTIDRDGRHEARQFDYPVHMTRVLAEGWRTLHTVAGDPASLHRTVGDGEVFITTLAAAAWLDPADPKPDLLRPLQEWLRTGDRQAEAAARQSAFDHFARAQIGYRTLALPHVAAVLGAYLLLLLGVGLWLMRRDRLERLAGVGLGFSLVAAAVLVVMGWRHQAASPDTLATAQIGCFFDDQPYVRLDERMSLYVGRDSGKIPAGDGGLAWPSLAAQGGDVMRMVHERSGRWRMDRLVLPPGAVTDLRVARMQPLDRPAAARIGWDAQGHLVGRLEGSPFDALDDAVLSSRDARMAVRFDADGSFTASLDDMLAPGQFMQAAMLGQTQQQRLEVYRQLLARTDLSHRGSLMGWSAAMGPGLRLDDRMQRRESGLFSLPLRLDRPAAPGRVTLAMPLLAMQPLRNAPNVTSASVFDDRVRSFIPNVTQEGDVMMRYVVPAELLPLKLEHVRVDFDLTALGYEVAVLIYRDDRPRAVASFSSPSLPQRLTLAGDDLPTLHADGWFAVGLRIAAGEAGPAGNKWSLRSLHAHAFAVTTGEH